ncbi:MAG: methyltransferase domain-containing protein [Acidobacteriota bacterium]|nr:methyltransferase domain-containing protein [Acidobacteriota bacterium]
MRERFHQRSLELEHLDKGDYTPEEYEGCIIELQRVNRWLGDARALRHSLLHEIESSPGGEFSVLDVGAGSGELLRVVAGWTRSRGRLGKLFGLELNSRSASAIMGATGDGKSQTFPEIVALRGDALRLPFANGAFDYAMCSLFTHHFKDGQVITVLRELARVARRRIFVIDLHRHPMAYYFYTTLGHLVLYNRLLREDGALSILRSFKPDELYHLAHEAGLNDITVERHFPYRLVLAASPPHSAERLCLSVGNTHTMGEAVPRPEA